MTKKEYEKCCKAMNEAIYQGKIANEIFNKKEISETDYLKAFEYSGFVLGVNQVLVSLGFKHEKMKELQEYLI